MQTGYQKGLIFEYLTMLVLFFKGYEILHHRFGKGQKGIFGEIDLIARKKHIICFIEVKYRKKHEDSAYAITQTQQHRIRNNAHLFIKQNQKYRNYFFRFDAFLYSKNTFPKHLKNVF